MDQPTTELVFDEEEGVVEEEEYRRVSHLRRRAQVCLEEWESPQGHEREH